MGGGCLWHERPSLPAAVTHSPLHHHPAAAAAGQLSVTGRPCVFPALYNGDMVTDCVPISGTLSCQVGWRGSRGAAGVPLPTAA